MSINKKYIESEIQRIVESLGFLFIEAVIRGNDRQHVLEIFVDSESGVSTDDCAEISRAINEFFELNEDQIGNYRLDVSSPGVDRDLKYLKQYPKHLNREFSVKYIIDEEIKEQKGKLKQIEGENLIFQFGKEEILIPFKKIKEAKVQISF